jgi:DNA-binding NarL/FixJ family response regulator
MEVTMTRDIGQVIKVLVVSDNHMIRAGVRMILETQETSYTIGEATTAHAAVEASTHAQADVLLIDLDLSGVDIVDLIQRLKTSAPNPLILVLSNLGDDELVRKALRAGAAGVVLKVQPPAVLNAAIESLCGISPKRSEMPPTRTNPLPLNGFPGELAKRQDVSRIGSLTKREREIIRLIGKGLKNKDIAGQLGISEITVRHHLSNIFSKLEVLDRQKLLIFAHRNRLVEMV